MKTWLHTSHFSHFFVATVPWPGLGSWTAESVWLQGVFSLVLGDLSCDPSFWLTRKLSHLNTLSSERSSQDPVCPGGKFLLVLPSPGSAGRYLKRKFLLIHWRARGALNSVWRGTLLCAHPRPVAIASDINESQGKHSGDWWQLYVQADGWSPSQPTMISFPSAINLTQLWGVRKPVSREREGLFPIGTESFWTLTFLKLSLFDKCRVPETEENEQQNAVHQTSTMTDLSMGWGAALPLPVKQDRQMCNSENAPGLGPRKAFAVGRRTVEVIPSSPMIHFRMCQSIHN